MTEAISQVAVLGAGLIGASWAEAFLARGLKVAVWDPRSDIKSRLAHLAQKYGAALTFADTAAAAVEGAGFVQESGPERLEMKRALFASLGGALGPSAVVASSTSTFQASELQRESPVADRIVIGHPFNPPHILPLVEVVGGTQTSEAAITTAMEFYRSIGKHPIRLHIERSGHLANRLQAAVWREAMDAVASGQASVADVDAAVTLALGPRWALMGPFATFQLGGGQGGIGNFFKYLGPAFEALWDDAKRPEVTQALKDKILKDVSASVRGRSPEEMSAARDRKLRAVLAIAGADDDSQL